MRLGILISGRGTNMESLAHACSFPDYPAEAAVVISNKADAKGLARAAEHG
ncbi:MAG: phosphoribosylglycinamide formyltransferase, partial [Alphaproteobacteria bacterium]|nr:phosphoribosylglycinamide formyltransferase [Alphaproteobacteria bacterium]